MRITGARYRLRLDRRSSRIRQWPRFRRLAFEPLEGRRMLAVLTVNSLEDNTISGDNLVTLREAILAANQDLVTDLGAQASGKDEIRFNANLFSSGPKTILLSHGEIVINSELKLTGPGSQLLTIDASGNDT